MLQGSISSFLVAVRTLQLNLQALLVNKGEMLGFNMFLEKVFQAEDYDRGIGGIQLWFFKLPYCIYSMLKSKKKTHQQSNHQKPRSQKCSIFITILKKYLNFITFIFSGCRIFH